MESIKGILDLLGAYPTWAKAVLLLNLAFALAVLVFARTPVAEAVAKTPTSSGTFVLKVSGVRFFPQQEEVEVQVTAYVNGTAYRYPSVAGVEWLAVASTMSGQTFSLPKADHYELRFEVLKRLKSSRKEVSKLVSQEVLTLTKSASDLYRVHGFDRTSGTRSGTIDGEVGWSLEVRP